MGRKTRFTPEEITDILNLYAAASINERKEMAESLGLRLVSLRVYVYKWRKEQEKVEANVAA